MAENYKYLCPSAGQLETLPIKVLSKRWSVFSKIYKKLNKPPPKPPGGRQSGRRSSRRRR